MKYMGSKRQMLANGLGKILRRRAADSKRFVDLFAGSGAVSWYVAENTASSVVAADLQQFAAVLAESVICRNQVIDGEALWLGWRTRAEALVEANPLLRPVDRFQGIRWERARRRYVRQARDICLSSDCTLLRAYGGHYFSPKQTLILDCLRTSLTDRALV